MRRAYCLTTIIVVLIASGAIALGQSPNKTGQEDVATTVAILDHIWLDAAHNRDTGTMAWLFADNFVEIHPGGDIVNKKEQIDQIADPQRANLELHPDNIQVRYASPDVAVLTDVTPLRGLSGGEKYGRQAPVVWCFGKEKWPRRAAGAGIVPISAQ